MSVATSGNLSSSSSSSFDVSFLWPPISSPRPVSSSSLFSPLPRSEFLCSVCAVCAVVPAESPAPSVVEVVVVGISVGTFWSSALASDDLTGGSDLVAPPLVSSASVDVCSGSVTTAGSPALPVPSLPCSRLTIAWGNKHNRRSHFRREEH